MNKSILILLTVIIFSCTQDASHEKLETLELRLTVDSFISVYEEAARIKDIPVIIQVTLVGNGNPYDNQYSLNTNSELVINGLIDKEYILFANATHEGTLYYKELKFNPAQTPSLSLVLEGIITRFKVTPTSWPEECEKVEVKLYYQWVTMIDETGYYLNKIFAGGGYHSYKAVKNADLEYYYATPFVTGSIEVVMYDKFDEILLSKETPLEKFFEKLKSYNIKIALSDLELEDMSAHLSFTLENVIFDEIELIPKL
jgi:hypothetical protein